MLLGLAATVAAESLPPFRVDPALLGTGAPVRKEPVPPLVVSAPALPPAPVVHRDTAPASSPLPPARQPDPVAAPAAGKSLPPPLAQTAEPPQVMDRPVPAPLYSAHVAAGELPAPILKPSRLLVPLARDAAERRPNFLSADSIHGRTDVEMVAAGAAELRKVGTVLNADRLTYWHLDDEVEALGNVRLDKDGDLYTGPQLRMRVEENTGFFERPTYSMPRLTRVLPGTTLESADELPASKLVTGRGEAERIEFLGTGVNRLSKATYTTCAPGNNDWYADVGDLNLDYNREVAEGSDGKVVFMGVPILYSPWIGFSLNNRRKSGLLAPTFGTTSTSGTEVSVPWYWNIAPNMEATITPRLMQKRGIQLNADVNYINYTYSGQTHVDYLPDDHLEHKQRYGYSIIHNQVLGHGFAGALNLNGVSDDTYFRDLSKPSALQPQNLLLRQGSLSYGANWWTAALIAQRYQVLQDPSLPPAAEPYRRLPQFNLAANRYDLPLGGAFNFAGEYVRFDHTTAVTGQRTTLYPQLSLPLQLSSFMQVTPKVGVHATRYALERQNPGTPDSLTRNVPIFSVDSSVVFERDADLFGRKTTQTLEPRLFYLYVPKRDQSQIPVFDTGLSDYGYAQIFAENRYSGGDRIADANQISATLTSRLIDPKTGAELIRGLIGQQFYFTTQHVTLPGEIPRSGRTADVVAALSGQVMPKTYVDAGLQYNPRDKATERFNLGGRYQPEIGKVLNAGYRYTRDQLGQVDVSGQWPLWGGWHGVGRYNYSMKDKRIIESVGGLEYDGGCWVGRIVVRRIATQIQQQTTSLFVQLELNGFSSLGTNPFEVLKRNVPGYWLINQQPTGAALMPN